MLNQNLKKIRIQNGFQQEDVANKLGVTKQTICNWEKGRRVPDIFMLIKIANLYDVTIDSLTGSDKRNQSIEILNIVSNLNNDTKDKLLDFLKVAVN